MKTITLKHIMLKLTTLRLITITVLFGVTWFTVPGHAAEPLQTPITETENQAEKQADRQAEKVLAQGRNLLRAGRYREARLVYEGREWAMQSDIFALIDNAKRQKKQSQALLLYETYFGFYPIGLDATDNPAEREKRTLDFVRLLSASPRAADRERATMELHAHKLYRAAEKLRDMGTAKLYAARSKQMVLQYPRSLFTVAAVVSSGDVLFLGDNEDEVLRHQEACLKAMQVGKAPARHRLHVLQQITQIAELEWTPTHWKIAYDAHRQIELLSDRPWEKAAALLGAAKAMGGISVSDASTRSRKLFSEVLQKYPRSDAAYEARRGLVASFLSARLAGQAYEAVREFEKQTGPGEIARLLLLIGQHLEGDRDVRAPQIYEEIARRFPRQGVAAVANISLGTIYGRRGDDAKMLAVYEKVATLTRADVDNGEMYLQEAQSDAFAALGNYYMKHEQWEEALKWWRGYRSGSFCGNGADAQNSFNALRIQLCLTKLGREAEAIHTLEEWAFKPHMDSAPGVAVILVDYYRNRNELAVLESRVVAALQKERSLGAVQMMQEYIEILQARQRGDVVALWKPFQHKSHSTLEYLQWQTKYGAKFLVELGDVARPFLLKKAPANPAAEHDDASAWACLLLARMKAPEVMPILQANLKTVRDADQLKYRLLALALLGSDESYAILQRIAQSSAGNWRKVAQQVLKTFPPGKEIKFLDSQEVLLRSGPGFEESWRLIVE